VPYTPPPALLRPEFARIPKLIARQSWMAAANINIDKDVIIATVKASVEQRFLLAELETRTFIRGSETVPEIMAMLKIPDEQVDGLWTSAEAL